MKSLLRQLPKVDHFVEEEVFQDEPKELVLSSVREVLKRRRAEILAGERHEMGDIAEDVLSLIHDLSSSLFTVAELRSALSSLKLEALCAAS